MLDALDTVPVAPAAETPETDSQLHRALYRRAAENAAGLEDTGARFNSSL